MQKTILFNKQGSTLSLEFLEEITLYTLAQIEKQILSHSYKGIKTLILNLEKVTFIDTAAAIFLAKMEEDMSSKNIQCTLICQDKILLATLELVKTHKPEKERAHANISFVEKELQIVDKYLSNYLDGIFSLIAFFGKSFMASMYYLSSFRHIRFKEIFYEINESAIKALAIVALTSFLVGLVVAYQSAIQLKIYGANIFIVDMLGVSILRELAPLITAIVIAGRSGSAFTAQIGAMKITQELDAMKTMGFDPFAFLVLPRIIALMIAMPILIFVADMMGIFGGMIVSDINLHVPPSLFLDRLREVVDVKHFFIGIIKGPFFAFLIASIGIYRGLVVKDDTQSIGFNTTKSVVESIFAVIVCDALFSIALTNLGI